MIKRIAVLVCLFLLPTSFLLAQKDSMSKSYTTKMPTVVKPSRDFFMLQIGYNNWVKKADSLNNVNTKSIGYVFNAFFCYDFPIKKSNMSFATGVGINTSVVYLNNQVLSVSDTGVRGNMAHFINDTVNYKRYKFNTVYLQAPFELRYYSNIQNRNKGFKAALGVQVGAFLGAHTKGLRSVSGVNIKDKENTKRYVSPWNFAATARVGFGNFAVFGSYNITNVFKDANGPVVTPFSFGLSISGL
ncbi:MAG: outer membrane beta-barrel protein [Taibaiella sp.]|nr:outer membrane beta-barrel protein [Taibaiella sp.]